VAASVVLVKMKQERYAWVTAAPASWLLICTLTAGGEKLFHPDPAIGFLAHATKFAAALSEGRILGPAANAAEMSRIVLNDRIDATLCALFMAVVVATAMFGVAAARRALSIPVPTCRESSAGDAEIALGILRPDARHA
jgi:carbon starvation protein